jgi:virulence factor Mce-like protein
MATRTPSLSQLAVMAAFALSCFALLLYLWLAFGGSIPLAPRGYRVTLLLPQSQQLAVESDVRISGIPVGKVVAISLGPDHRVHATLQLDGRYAPLHSGVTATLRAKSLLGETFVELAPGPRADPAIPEGGTIAAAQVAPSVTFDEVLRTFDPATRVAFQGWLQGLSAGLGGTGAELNGALGELDPFSSDGGRLLADLDGQRAAVAALVRNTQIVVGALNARQGQLRTLVSGANRTFAATAASDRALAAAVVGLPAFERGSIAALRRLDRFAADASPVLDALAPTENALAPAVSALRGAAPPLQALLTGLGPLSAASTRGEPALEQTLAQLTPPLTQLAPALRQLRPLLAFVGGYQGELQAALANLTAASEAQNIPSEAPNAGLLHYLRTSTPLNPGSLGLSAAPSGSSRANAYLPSGAFANLAGGLPVLDAATCANPTPNVTGPPNAFVTTATLGLLGQLGVAPVGGALPAPPCRPAPTGFTQVPADPR